MEPVGWALDCKPMEASSILVTYSKILVDIQDFLMYNLGSEVKKVLKVLSKSLVETNA